MGTRLELQTLLEGLIVSPNVYFQPPPNFRMEYPCVVYKRDTANTDFAGNKPYKYVKRYQVTVLSRDPDSDIPDKIAALPTCVHVRFFTANQLNHDVFALYF